MWLGTKRLQMKNSEFLEKFLKLVNFITRAGTLSVWIFEKSTIFEKMLDFEVAPERAHGGAQPKNFTCWRAH